MSERSSFCTSYIYCEDCLQAAKDVLLGDDKYLCSRQIESWSDDMTHLPIVAGKIGGLYAGEELHDMESEFLPVLAQRVSHPVRMAVLSECGGESIFLVTPGLVRISHHGDCLSGGDPGQ